MKSITGVWDGLVGEYAMARMEIESPTSGRLWIGWPGGELRYYDLINIVSGDRSLVLHFAKTNSKEVATIRARGNADVVDGRITAEIVLDEVSMGGGPFQLFKLDGRSFLGRVADMQRRIEEDVTKRTGVRPAEAIPKGSSRACPQIQASHTRTAAKRTKPRKFVEVFS